MNSYEYSNQVFRFTPENREYTLIGLEHKDKINCYFTKNKVYFSKEPLNFYPYRIEQGKEFLYREGTKIIILY